MADRGGFYMDMKKLLYQEICEATGRREALLGLIDKFALLTPENKVNLLTFAGVLEEGLRVQTKGE